MAFRKRLQAVHVPHHKNTAGMKAETLPPPKEVLLPMNMHMGTPAVPVVSVGDYVRVGQKLARGEGSITCEVHATVSGTVLSLDPMPELFGNDLPVIRIENDGKMEVDPTLAPRTAEDLAAFVEDLHESGIVGLGGAAFPVWAKLDAVRRNKIKTVLINGAECEPYITGDHRAMLERTEEIIGGASYLVKMFGVDKAIIGVEDNKKNGIEALNKVIAEQKAPVVVEALRCRYPQGGEKQLCQAITGKQVPPGGLPANIGCAVFNINTTIAIYHAIKDGMPVVRKVVTVSGSGVVEPKNLECPIGTPVSLLRRLKGRDVQAHRRRPDDGYGAGLRRLPRGQGHGRGAGICGQREQGLRGSDLHPLRPLR